jgi:hypothetical protein
MMMDIFLSKAFSLSKGGLSVVLLSAIGAFGLSILGEENARSLFYSNGSFFLPSPFVGFVLRLLRGFFLCRNCFITDHHRFRHFGSFFLLFLYAQHA